MRPEALGAYPIFIFNGFTVVVIAALEHDALRLAPTMLAFGIGTAPAMIAVALEARRAAGFAAGSTGKRLGVPC